MATTFEPAAIYVDIDTLFDMRAATLASMGDGVLETAVVSGYYDREVDAFTGVDTAAFQVAYAARDINTMKNAMVTPVIGFILYFAKKTLLASVDTPFRRQPKLVLNVYPYVLSPEDKEALIQGIRAATEQLVDIEIVELTLEALTPHYVHSHYVTMVMYAYGDWLEVHSVNRNLVESRCQQISLIGPRLIKSEEAAKTLEGQDVFTAIETYTGLFIKLQLYPVNMFCVDLPRLEKSKKR